MRADQRQINAGSWNPDEPLKANLVIEHRPVTYKKWLFADIDPEELFSTGTESRRITFLGDIGVVVKKDGKGIAGIDERGNVAVPEGGEHVPGRSTKGVFMVRNGKQTVVNHPADTDYEILFETLDDSTISIFDIIVSPHLLRSRPGKMYIGRVQPGLYRMNISADCSPDKPEAVSKDVKNPRFTTREFTYSPAVIMRDELDATRDSFLSLSGAIMYGFIVMNGLVLLLLLCMLTFIIHRFRVRRGHAPFSDWYVIFPHLIFIAVFAAMTQYMTFFMFTIGKARAQCAAATVLIIALLSIRGTIRSKRPAALIISTILVLMVPLAGTYYNNLPIDSFSMVNMIMYFVMVTFLSVLAIMNFRKEKTPTGSSKD